MDAKYFKRIKKKHFEIAPEMYWGDDLDVRFKLFENLSQIKRGKVLDICCNIGALLFCMGPSVEKYGIDIDEECIIKGKNLNPDADLQVGDMYKLPFEDGFFDYAIIAHSVPHSDFRAQNMEASTEALEASKRAFSEAMRVLKEGGVLYVTTPNKDSFPYRKSNKSTFTEMRNLIESLQYKELKFYGWNLFYENPVYRKLSQIPGLKYMVHPRVLANFDFVWKKLEATMEETPEKAKYFYVEIKK